MDHKIIALVPVKNESWVLDFYLETISKVADTVVILDDNSDDGTSEIAQKYEKVTVYKNEFTGEEYVDFSDRRNKLLEIGRSLGGTHFIWLDADEIFSNNFISNARKAILSLKPGEKILMPWVTLWKSFDRYISDKSVWANQYKDFIVCDDKNICFEKRFIHEARTPGTTDKVIKIPFDQGVVLHLQFINYERNQLKQALYRCSELIEGSRNARRINASYLVTLDFSKIETKETRKEWLDDMQLKIAAPYNIKDDWRYEKIVGLFDKYTIEFFEDLQIWHIKELSDEFISRTGRAPQSKSFPLWLIRMNDVKNKIKNLV